MKKKIFLFLVTVTFLYFVVANLNAAELFKIIRQFNVVFIIPLSLSIIISLSLRGLVFKQLLQKSISPSLFELAHLCITSAAMNILMPARSGDFFRAFYIGHKYKIDKFKVFGTIIFERFFDIIVIFSFLLTGIFLYHKSELANQFCLFSGLCITACIAAVLYAYKFNKTDAICNFFISITSKLPFSDLIKKLIGLINCFLNSFFKGFEAVESPKRLLFTLITSLFIWLFECLNFYLVIAGFGCSVHWSVTLFVISFIAVACMVPSTSIYIGPYQFAIIEAFNLYGIKKETALAISLVEQSVVIIVTSIIALAFFIKHNISYKSSKESLEQFCKK